MDALNLGAQALSAQFCSRSDRVQTNEITHNIEAPWSGAVDEWDTIEAQHNGSWVDLFVVTSGGIEAAERVLTRGSHEGRIVRLRRNGMGGGL